MLYSQYIEIESQEGGKTEEDRDTEKEAHRQTEYRERERERERERPSQSRDRDTETETHRIQKQREREIWRYRHKGTQTDRNTERLRQKRGGREGRTGGGKGVINQGVLHSSLVWLPREPSSQTESIS